MPVFEMPLDQLKVYQGRNPKPDGFDAFWDNSLKEMRAINEPVEFAAGEFQTPFAACQDLFFTGVGGARIHAKVARPSKRASKPRPAVLMFHGYSGSAGDWTSLLGYAAMGYTVAALDCRGQGGLSEDVGGVTGNTLHGHIIRGLDGPPDKLLFRQIFLDTAQLARIVMAMPDVDADRVGVTGGSQGGGLALACAALEPRIKLAAPVYPFLCDYRRVWEMDLAKGAYQELDEYFRRFDPRHEREEQMWAKLGHIDVQHLCRRIRAKVLMGVGLMDQICPPSSQFAAYNKIQSDKELAIYPDFGHENLPGHSDTIFKFLSEL